MAEIVSYSEVLVKNINIWQQAVMMGVLMVAASGLMGFLLSSVSIFFKMISRG